jgi:hypothetical protein
MYVCIYISIYIYIYIYVRLISLTVTTLDGKIFYLTSATIMSQILELFLLRVTKL